MKAKEIIKIKDNEGKTIEVEVLLTFLSEETNKKYVIYTPMIDEEGDIDLYTGLMVESENGITIEDITLEEDKKVIKILEEQLKEG